MEVTLLVRYAKPATRIKTPRIRGMKPDLMTRMPKGKSQRPQKAMEMTAPLL